MRSQRHIQSTFESRCWIDDLEVCKQSGVGFSTNQIYREDGNRQEEHTFEDRSFHCKFDEDNNSFLYGVFDGHEGDRAVDFCVQRMPAEILLGQLHAKLTDEEIKEVLRQAFTSVEKGYMDSIDDLLAERACYEMQEGMNHYEIYRQPPDVIEKIKKINNDISCGAAAAITLIYNNKLYVANVGNCRVLLCQTDANSVLKVVQLSVDHDLRNEDELLRLSQMGINITELRKHSHLGNQENTRCLGNYLVKGGYKELEDMAMATGEPINSEPDVIGGITLDDTHRFLLLMSAGLYKSIEDAMRVDQVNKYIAQCVVEQFREQATITGVAQAVVDKVVRLHHDWHMTNSVTNDSTKREDITLVVRNFNFPMPNAIRSPTTPSVTFNPLVSTAILSAHTTLTNSNHSLSGGNSTDTNSSTNSYTPKVAANDPDERIIPYVDFNEFYENVELAKLNGTLPEGIDL